MTATAAHARGLSHPQTIPIAVHTFHQLPAEALRPFVDRFWGWESAPSEQVRLPTLPPGTGAELYLHYGAPFRIESTDGAPLVLDQGHVFCIRDTPLPLAAMAGIGFIAVRFRIGMLRRFTGIPAHELSDRHLCVQDIWGVAGTRLLRQIGQADSRRQRIAHLQHFLLRHLRRDSEDALVEQAMGLLYRQHHWLSIDMLADRVGLGRRQLERRWERFAGQSPRQSKGLIRFQQAMRGLMLSPAASVLDTALACGYFDQAHFIRDFQARMHATPGQYLRLARHKSHFYNTPAGKDGMLATPDQCIHGVQSCLSC